MPEDRGGAADRVDNILIVRLGSLGDIVHGLPVAAALRAAFPRARIDWLVDAKHRPILDLVPIIDRRLVLGGRSENGSPGERVREGWRTWIDGIRELRKRQYDIALDLQGLIKSAVLARSSRAGRIIGLAPTHLRERAARLFYTETCEPSDALHVVDQGLAVLGALGIRHADVRFPIEVPRSDVPAMLRARLGIGTEERFAVINPGAAWPNKRWPPERFGGLAAALRARHGLPSGIVWGPGEEELARAVALASGGAAVVAPPTRISDLVALLKASTVVVSGDTGPLHIAAAVGAPIVGIYGPTAPERNGPWAAADVTVSRYRECACHHLRRCRLSACCLTQIPIGDVLSAVERRLTPLPTHV